QRIQRSVERASSVLPPAYPALGHRLSIIDAVMHWLDGPQECEDRLQVFIAHMCEVPPRHVGTDLARTHLAGADGFQELCFIVITDTGRVRRNVCARRLFRIGTNSQITACKFQARKRVSVYIAKRVTPLAARNLYQVSTAFLRRADVGLWNRAGDRNSIG